MCPVQLAKAVHEPADSYFDLFILLEVQWGTHRVHKLAGARAAFSKCSMLQWRAHLVWRIIILELLKYLCVDMSLAFPSFLHRIELRIILYR